MQTETLLPDRLRDMKAATMNATPDSGRCDILLGDYQTVQVLEVGEWWEQFASEADAVYLIEASKEAVNEATFLLAQGKKNTSRAKRLVVDAPTNATGRQARIQLNANDSTFLNLKRVKGTKDCQVSLLGPELGGRAILQVKRS